LSIDVFAEEPVKADNENYLLPNFIATTHNAGLINEARDVKAMSCVYSIDDVLSCRDQQYPVNKIIKKLFK
jgi:phosphoglycerate dehydrogenase-like enzyme